MYRKQVKQSVLLTDWPKQPLLLDRDMLCGWRTSPAAGISDCVLPRDRALNPGPHISVRLSHTPGADNGKAK